MRIDLKARRVELSAQEFATFRPGPAAISAETNRYLSGGIISAIVALPMARWS